MEKHESMTQSYYRGSKFVLLVYSADDEYSLHRLSGIANMVKRYEPSAKLILLKNKIDLPISSDTIPEEKEKALRREIEKNVIACFSTSAKTRQGVDDLLKQLAEYSLKLFKRQQEAFDDDEDKEKHSSLPEESALATTTFGTRSVGGCFCW